MGQAEVDGRQAEHVLAGRSRIDTNGLAEIRQSVSLHQTNQAAIDPFDHSRTFINQRRQQLNRRRATTDFVVGVLGRTYTSGGDDLIALAIHARVK